MISEKKSKITPTVSKTSLVKVLVLSSTEVSTKPINNPLQSKSLTSRVSNASLRKKCFKAKLMPLKNLIIQTFSSAMIFTAPPTIVTLSLNFATKVT